MIQIHGLRQHFDGFRKGFQRCLLALAVLVAPTAQAHPHSFADMKTYIQGKNGEITGFRMEWTFDAMTSAYMLDGEDTSPENVQHTFRKMAASMLENIQGEQYFTHFYDGDQPLQFKPVHSGQLTRDRAKLVLSFVLPLSHPKPLTQETLRLLVFEPSFYLGMTWDAAEDVVLSDELARRCRVALIEPDPTPEQVSYAMSLPADANPDNTLGQLFTQTVQIHCEPTTDGK